MSEAVLKEKIIEGKEIWRLTRLTKAFVKIIKEVEGIDAEGYKTHNLKNRIKKAHSIICFSRPSRFFESDIVFAGSLDVMNAIRPGEGLVLQCAQYKFDWRTDFAQLDMLVRQKPAARVTTLETIIMWTNNKTPEWLDGLSEEERIRYMKVAREQSSHVLNHYNERKNK